LTSQPNPPRQHRLSNIFEGLLSHIITGNLDLAPDLPIRIIGHADPARFGDALKAGSNVYAITEDVVVIENDVTDMNADPEFDPLIRRHGIILFGHAALDFNRTAHRIDGAGKLDQNTVARRLDDVASMGGYGGVNDGHGSENLSSVTQKEFCNTIPLRADIAQCSRHVRFVPARDIRLVLPP